MSLKRRALSPRGLVALIVVITIMPLVALLWLGWQLVERDRVLEDQRAQERVELAADLLVAAFERALSLSEQRLAAGAADWPPGAVALTFRKDRVEANPKDRLAYLPVVSALPEAPSGALSAGDDLEFRQKDTSRAIEFFRGLATAPNAATRASALLRLGRNLASAGRVDEALATYEQLTLLDSVAIGGTPASLAGRWARCELLEKTGRSADHKREVQQLANELRSGRWALPGDLYQLYVEDIAGWSGADVAGKPEAEFFAEAAALMWERRPSLPNTGRERIVLEDQEFVALWQGSGESVRLLIAAPEFVESEWLTAVAPVAAERNVSFQLNQRNPSNTALAASRVVKQTELPWDFVVASLDAGYSAAFALRQRMLIAGFGLLTALAFTASYLILRAVRRELAVARFQSDFVAAVSHEFRTPLTTLRQFTEMLRDKERFAPDEGKERRLLSYDAQSRATDRLTRLVESLLDFGRLKAGAYPYKFEPRDCTAFVSHVVEDFRLTAETAGHDVRFSGNGAAVIEADSEALGRALWNLLDNAVKYSPDQRTIEVGVYRQGEEVLIGVRDEGIGIPAHEHSAIFARFQRGEQSRTRGIKGTGIGLAMVDEIVRAHHGRIDLNSEPGKGSTFTIVLPVKG